MVLLLGAASHLVTGRNLMVATAGADSILGLALDSGGGHLTQRHPNVLRGTAATEGYEGSTPRSPQPAGATSNTLPRGIVAGVAVGAVVVTSGLTALAIVGWLRMWRAKKVPRDATTSSSTRKTTGKHRQTLRLIRHGVS